MTATVGASTTGTATAALPPGTADGDYVVVFAYRSASATPPTLPADWVEVVNRAVIPSLRVQYRIKDASWSTMPTFTNATTCHAVQVSAATGIGAATVGGATNATITWAALALQVTGGSSAVLRGAIHTRPNSVIPTSAGHVLEQAAGTQPGYITQHKTDTTNGDAASSTTGRSDTHSWGQVEVLGSTSPAGTAAGTFTFVGDASGASDRSGTATGTALWVGAAEAPTTPAGTGAGAVAYTGAATASTDRAGSAVGTLNWVATGLGATARTGAAGGTLTWGGTAVGSRDTGGAAAGQWAWSSTAAAVTYNGGTASGAWAYMSAAAGAPAGGDLNGAPIRALGPIGHPIGITGPTARQLTTTGPRS